MSDCITVHKMYKYRLYCCNKRDLYLHQQINVAGRVWNHALVLQRRYYQLTRKYIPLSRLQAHIAKLRMTTERYACWKPLGSQAVQDICKRLDSGYQRFFQRSTKRPPKFKKVKRYPSFTLKQWGWKLLSYNQNQRRPNGKYRRARGVVEISGVAYKFIQHYPMGGSIKTVTIKRDGLGRLWVCFSVIEDIPAPNEPATGEAAGFDFGLKMFLTDHAGNTYSSPLFFKQELKRIRTLQKRKDKKPHGTNNRWKAEKLLTRAHIRIADKRRDHHFQLAHRLCDQYDGLYFEDLNLNGMKALWGRKVSDLGFASFLEMLEWVAFKRGKHMVKIDRWYPSTQQCSHCGYLNSNLTLRDRGWVCPECTTHHMRDHNSAKNIYRAGTSAHTGLGVVRPASVGGPA